MKIITGLSEQPKQQSTLVLADGTRAVWSISYVSQQTGWFYDLSWNDTVIATGQRMVSSPNILRQYINKISFGIAIVSPNQLEPTTQTALIDGTVTCYLLEGTDLQTIETTLFNAPAGQVQPVATTSTGTQVVVLPASWGPAGGDLAYTYPNPQVVAMHDNTGQRLAIATIEDGRFLKRDGESIVGATVSPGTGDVVGPGSSTAGNIAVFADTGGSLIADGGALGTAAFVNSSSFLGATAAASGDLSGNYPGPNVAAIHTTSGGGTKLTIGAVADGQYLVRSGNDLIGGTPSGAGDVFGPSSAVTVGTVALFATTDGKTLGASGVTLGSIASQSANSVNITGGNISSVSITSSTAALTSLSVNSSTPSTYGSIEVSGTAGAFIDLKAPDTDDYDLRLITGGGGGQIAASGDTNLDLLTNNTRRARINTSGLSVTGDITATGVLSANQINGVALSSLGTGILKNTTTTGVPSIAIAADFPTLNQNTSGTAASLSSTLTVAKGGTGLTAVGSALQVLRTKADLSGLEYATISAGGGDVTGPSSAVDGGVALFDGTTGKIIKDGGKNLYLDNISLTGGLAASIVQADVYRYNLTIGPGGGSFYVDMSAYNNILIELSVPYLTLFLAGIISGEQVFLIIRNNSGSTATLTYPAWTRIGNAFPDTLPPGQTLQIKLVSTGTTVAGVLASCTVSSVFNIGDFGASPSATAATNTTAIINAFAAADSAGSASVCIPQGIFNCNKITVTLTAASKVTLMGAGQSASFLKFDCVALNDLGLKVTLGGNSTNDRCTFEIQNLTFWARSSGANNFAGTAVEIIQSYPTVMHFAPSFKMLNCWIRSDCCGGSGYWSNGVSMSQCHNFVIDNCWISGKVNDYVGSGIYYQDAIVNGTITNSQLNYWSIGVNCPFRMEGLNAVANYLIECNIGFKIIGLTSGTKLRSTAFYAAFNNLDCRGTSPSCFYLENVSAAMLTNNEMVQDGGSAIIDCLRVFESSFSSNTIYGPSTYGIHFAGSPDVGLNSISNTVIGNIFRGQSTNVLIDANNNGIIVTNNRSNDSDSDNTLDWVSVTDNGSSNLCGESKSFSTVQIVDGSTLFTFDYDITTCQLGTKPSGVTISLGSEFGSNIVGGYDFDNSTKTAARIKVWRTDGSALPSGAVRFNLCVNP